MKKNGVSIPELVVTIGIFTVVFAAVVMSSQVGVKAAFLNTHRVQIVSDARNLLAKLSNEISSSDFTMMSVKPCNAVGCQPDTNVLIMKEVVKDGTPIVGTTFASDGSIKFGAGGKQNCWYEYYVNTQKQLIKNMKCDTALNYCGDGGCSPGSENASNCAYDCGSCGDGICSSIIGESLASCNDCVVCGDGICSPGEDCASFFCEDCGCEELLGAPVGGGGDPFLP